MSDVETSDTDEEFDSEDVIVIKSFAAQNGKGKNPRSEAGTARHILQARSHARGPIAWSMLAKG